jgi:serine O-acetyltransferase
VRGDFAQMQRGRAKYLGDTIHAWQLPLEAIRKIGFQMLIAVRTMQFFRDARLGLLAQISSRMIRYIYGAEIHWDAQLEPGLYIMHGNGLVIGASVRVEEGCVLSQNVTLGAAYDAESGENAGPHLERDVHVGPGATLLGRITVGAGSKVMAGAVLTVSVPAMSLVTPPASIISVRRAASPIDAAAVSTQEPR